METLAAILGAFLLAGYVQTHEVQAPPQEGDSGRMERVLDGRSEFQDVVSTYTAAPVDIYATYTPILGSGKGPKWEKE